MAEDKAQLNFTVVPDEDTTVPRVYSNFCAIQNSPFDFTLTFCEMLPLGERQVKEAQASVLERFVGRSRYENHGQRVVVGQRLMQATSDIFLGWLQLEGADGRQRDYYVRQLHDWKGSVNVGAFRVPGMTLYARLCGATLARAHARLGDRVAIAAYLGRGDAFERALADFSVAYADQNERDYEAFVNAVKKGRLSAETGR